MTDNEPSNSTGSGARPSGDERASERQWQLMERLLMQASHEQRKSRRWGIFFKGLGMAYLFLVLFAFWPSDLPDAGPVASEPHTAVVDVQGMILQGEEAAADNLVKGLRDAFEADKAKAVLLRINSPGGSPVESDFVFDEIMRLKKKHEDKKVYASVTDVAASGGYYVAAAADEIYASPASIVGSIGVLSSGFGFTQLMDKIGVQRRLMTAGQHKGMMDPFSPLQQGSKAHMNAMLERIHGQFIESVKQGRGDRLKDDADLFSGLFWSGERAKALGLVDGLGSPGYVAREVIGEKDLVDYTKQPGALQRLMERVGASAGQAAVRALGGGITELR